MFPTAPASLAKACILTLQTSYIFTCIFKKLTIGFAKQIDIHPVPKAAAILIAREGFCPGNSGPDNAFLTYIIRKINIYMNLL